MRRRCRQVRPSPRPASVQSPQTSRCGPRSQTSPIRLTGIDRSIRGHHRDPSGLGAARLQRTSAPDPRTRPARGRSPAQSRSATSSIRICLSHPGILRELVVGEHVGPALRLAPTARDHDGRFQQTQLPGGKHAAVARDDRSLLIDEHWMSSSPTPGSTLRSAPPARRHACGRCSHKVPADRAAIAPPCRQANRH